MSATQSPSSALPEGVDVDGRLQTQGLGTVAWVTDVGLVRGRNEDRLLVKPAFGGDYLLLLVADGAGGHDSGDKAAEQAVETFNACFPEEGPIPPGEVDTWLADAIDTAHANVRGLAEGQARPPASTIVGVLIEKESLCGWRFHVGDSRLYVRQDKGMVAQWTRDHNITNGLIDRGLPVAQALRIADGGRLTQVLGGISEPEPEILGPLKFDPGTVLLLCSDGIYGHNGDREVLLPAMNRESGDVVDRAAELKAAVLAGDAPDNLTAVLWEVPEDAVHTRDRVTVTNSMRSVTAEDVEKALARKVRQELGLGPGPDDMPAQTTSSPPSGGGMKWMLILAVLAVAAIVYVRGQEPPPEPTPAPTPEEEPELSDAGMTHEPMDAPNDALADLVRGFDQAWWIALPTEQRDESLRLLSDLMRVNDAAPVTLTSPLEGDAAYSMDGWPQAGGSNAAAAAAAWAARSVVITQHGDLTEQPGVRESLLAAACARVEISWPRSDSLDPGEALQLSSWLAACLEAPGSSVQVRLGGWPARGWSLDELNQAKFLANRNDPDGLLRYADAENPRILELSLLASALRQPIVAGLDVELAVVQPDGDFQEGNLPEERVLQAASRAGEIVGMLRSAVGDGVTLRGSGRVASDLTAVFGANGATPEQQQELDDLDRRIDVLLSRPFTATLAPDEAELPGEPIEGTPEDDELPGEATEEPAAEPTAEPAANPAQPADAAPADDELPGEPATAP